jgi:ferritin-like metal-binding protein YciE
MARTTKNDANTKNGKSDSLIETTSKNGTSKFGKNKSEKTLDELFEENLKDIYSAEKQLVEALPVMAKAAYSEDLQDAINEHLQQTNRQVERLEKIFERLDIKKEEKKCKAMEGLIKEGNDIIDEFDRSPVRDSALIIGAQKIEHYEIAAYGSLCELAEVLRYPKIAEILYRTLEEEEDADEKLTCIAENVNDEAYEIHQTERIPY